VTDGDVEINTAEYIARGADRAIEILADEVVRTMKLLGVRSIADLEPAHVERLDR
jgi:L-lactate dehydrogenase (cytochrome)